MKRILLFILAAFVALSCQDDAKPDGCGVELKLVDMISSWMPNQHTAGQDMPYQETIVLSKESTFIKIRTQDGVKSEEKGTYVYVSIDNRRHVQLRYNASATALRTSCSIEGEIIEVISSTQFKNTSWMACDGPTLVYEAKTAACNE